MYLTRQSFFKFCKNPVYIIPSSLISCNFIVIIYLFYSKQYKELSVKASFFLSIPHFLTSNRKTTFIVKCEALLL